MKQRKSSKTGGAGAESSSSSGAKKRKSDDNEGAPTGAEVGTYTRRALLLPGLPRPAYLVPLWLRSRLVHFSFAPQHVIACDSKLVPTVAIRTVLQAFKDAGSVVRQVKKTVQLEVSSLRRTKLISKTDRAQLRSYALQLWHDGERWPERPLPTVGAPGAHRAFLRRLVQVAHAVRQAAKKLPDKPKPQREAHKGPQAPVELLRERNIEANHAVLRNLGLC